MVAIGQAGSGEAEDPLIPILPREDYDPVVPGISAVARELLLCQRDQITLGDLAIAVVVEEDLRQVLGTILVLRRQQEEGDLGIAGAVCRVELGGDEITDIPRVDPFHIDR